MFLFYFSEQFYIGQKNNNFNGKIRSVEYFNDALNIQEVENFIMPMQIKKSTDILLICLDVRQM